MPDSPAPRPQTVLLNGSYAPSLINFRGPLIRALLAAGHRVHVSAPAIPDAIRATIEQWGAQVHQAPLSRAGLNPVADLGYFRFQRALIRAHRIDRVIGYTIKPAIWGSLAARSAGVRSASMVTGLGYAFIPGTGAKRRAIAAVSRRLWRWATAANDVVLFQNPDDRDDFIAAGALADPGKARMIDGSGVDLAHFAPAPLPGDAVFLMISRFLVNKGVREYAQAAMRLKAAGSPWRFLLVGFLDQGPDAIARTELDSWIAGGIEYLGAKEDVRPALAEASVYVLPSYREGTPRTVLEAMAMRRAIITSDAPGCRETIIDGASGLLVPPRDVDALAAAMKRLGDDGAMRAAMADAAYARARDKYAVERVNRALMGHVGL